MIFFYISVPALSLLLSLIFRRYKRELFNKLDNKEHPLRFLYPAAARVFDLIRVIYPTNAHSNVSSLLKQLCVRENVENEIYIYNIKKISSIAGIFNAVCIVGMLLFISTGDDALIRSLVRPNYGQGQNVYQLEVEYDNTSETVELTLDAAQMTEDEILKTFDESYESILERVLGENESADNVSLPVDLITSYGVISIEWEIDDPRLLNYNGEISSDIEENEFVQVNLYATFSINETSRVYTVPLLITGKTVTARELLIRNIYESIEQNNSAYDTEVALPETINGKPLAFRPTGERPDRIVLILGMAAVILLIFGYDKSLEKKLKERRDEMAMDFTEIVFKLSLLYEAGLSIFRAFERIVTEYENTKPKKPHFAYREMRLTIEQIKNGASEAAAYGQFGRRCGLHQYIKLGNILEQNIRKGARGMKSLLRQEAQDSFEERKRLARKKGEEASTKMMIPMIMMLVVVLVIIAVPAIMSIRF